MYYVVLHKLDKTPLIDIQEMTFILCYLFGRSATSVGLVPGAYYTDKVCNRARCYYRRAYTPFAPGDFNPADFVLQPHEDVRESRSHVLHLIRPEILMMDGGGWSVDFGSLFLFLSRPRSEVSVYSVV